MYVKKSHGKIFGANLTAAEQKALNMEIQKSFAEYDRKNADEIDAILLWFLHEKFGFGYERLKKIHKNVNHEVQSLCDRYEMTDNGDELWLCTHKLKEIGIDISEWNSEVTDE